MECSGISEAGGVKNVTFSLCKEFCKSGNFVTLFIPFFGCTDLSFVKKSSKNSIQSEIFICGENQKVEYSFAKSIPGNFEIVFINHGAFLEKKGVYTYTEIEEKQNPEHKKGLGHKDEAFMDVFFQKAVCKFCELVPSKKIPDIIHCQDAATALIPFFAKENQKLNQTKFVVTIHNAGPGYHHAIQIDEASRITGFSHEFLNQFCLNNMFEPFIAAANSNAKITTVSEKYASEITSKEKSAETQGLSLYFSEKNIFIKGITNGIDFENYDPSDKKKSLLPFEFNPSESDFFGKTKCRNFLLSFLKNDSNFSEEKKSLFEGVKINGFLDAKSDSILVAYHGRITVQKGIEVLLNAIPLILKNEENVFFIIAGQGEKNLEEMTENVTKKFLGKVVFLNGYNKKIARLSVAVSDFIALPSFFEPCGLEDFIAQIYGTIPVAAKTGGLTKIIDDEKNRTGFLYEKNTSENLSDSLQNAFKLKRNSPKNFLKIAQNAALYVKNNFGWEKVVNQKYLPYFYEILQK